MSFMSFVGGSLGSTFKLDEVVEVTCVGVMHAEDMMTGDEDLFSFDSLLKFSKKSLKIAWQDTQPFNSPIVAFVTVSQSVQRRLDVRSRRHSCVEIQRHGLTRRRHLGRF